MKRLRADFCAPSFEERRSPGLVAGKGQWKERLRAGFLCALI